MDLKAIRERAENAKKLGWGAVPQYVSHAYSDIPALLNIAEAAKSDYERNIKNWQCKGEHDSEACYEYMMSCGNNCEYFNYCKLKAGTSNEP